MPRVGNVGVSTWRSKPVSGSRYSFRCRFLITVTARGRSTVSRREGETPSASAIRQATAMVGLRLSRSTFESIAVLTPEAVDSCCRVHPRRCRSARIRAPTVAPRVIPWENLPLTRFRNARYPPSTVAGAGPDGEPPDGSASSPVSVGPSASAVGVLNEQPDA